MAFNSANLVLKRVLGDGRRAYAYSTSDSLVTIGAGGYPYFSTTDAAKALRTDDIIAVSASDGKAMFSVESADPLAPEVSLVKIASGVTSFEYLA